MKSKSLTFLSRLAVLVSILLIFALMLWLFIGSRMHNIPQDYNTSG